MESVGESDDMVEDSEGSGPGDSDTSEGSDEPNGSDTSEGSDDSDDSDSDDGMWRTTHSLGKSDPDASEVWPHLTNVKPSRVFKTTKDVNFYGASDRYVVSGSDDGYAFIWDKRSTRLVQLLAGDSEVVNVIQGHPHAPVIAVSGIDSTIKIFEPIYPNNRLWSLDMDALEAAQQEAGLATGSWLPDSHLNRDVQPRPSSKLFPVNCCLQYSKRLDTDSVGDHGSSSDGVESETTPAQFPPTDVTTTPALPPSSSLMSQASRICSENIGFIGHRLYRRRQSSTFAAIQRLLLYGSIFHAHSSNIDDASDSHNDSDEGQESCPGIEKIGKPRARLILPRQVALVTETDEGLVNETDEGLVTETDEGLVTETDEGLVTETDEGLVTETDEGLVTETDEGLVTETDEGLVTETDEGLVTETDEGLVNETDEGQSQTMLCKRARHGLSLCGQQ
ncbi:uncharacterized protein BJ171DRAFT_473401 [Polychytrium aggregatum]|uniref:uncharacterized protein n=1 Tax=Polychytrium aggregatum TaxID=110093 RepID=UPI0022FE3A08|nr:uncharacterized protein BJ171DRAFT_473401 [Polychytrium aggregatum]KAI9206394.1 hypothetical protein BJ171DRAFT_473401 [Polychytrium aggregatum]